MLSLILFQFWFFVLKYNKVSHFTVLWNKIKLQFICTLDYFHTWPKFKRANRAFICSSYHNCCSGNQEIWKSHLLSFLYCVPKILEQKLQSLIHNFLIINLNPKKPSSKCITTFVLWLKLNHPGGRQGSRNLFLSPWLSENEFVQRSTYVILWKLRQKGCNFQMLNIQYSLDDV